MTKTGKEALDRLMDVFFGPADPTAMTLFQAETLMGLLIGEIVEDRTPERPKVHLSEGACRLFLQELEMSKRGLVEIDKKNLLRLTPAGEAMAVALVSRYCKMCQRLLAPEMVADRVKKAQAK